MKEVKQHKYHFYPSLVKEPMMCKWSHITIKLEEGHNGSFKIYILLSQKICFLFKLFGDWVELGTLDNFCTHLYKKGKRGLTWKNWHNIFVSSMAINCTASEFLWLRCRGIIRGGVGGRGGGIFWDSRRRCRGRKLFYGDSDKVGGDVGHHYILAAWCHFRVPVRVSFCWHPF